MCIAMHVRMYRVSVNGVLWDLVYPTTSAPLECVRLTRSWINQVELCTA